MTRIRVGVVGHDAGINAIARALYLAELLEPRAEVRVVAFGDHVWPPAIGDRAIELLPNPRSTIGLPAAAAALRGALRDVDLIVAVKPRVMSYGLAAIVRGRRPLILDIDDLEHRFTRRRLGWLRQIVEPDREPATRFLERWRAPVAAITVASRALQRRFGGMWLPHVRDRSGLARAALAEGPSTRARLGLDGTFVAAFVGTVRPHKGLPVLAAAVARLGEDARLLLAGDLGDEASMSAIRQQLGQRVVAVPWPAMDEIGGLLGASDVVVIPQSRTPEAIYQSPMKLLDALAAGRPVVAGDVGDAAELIGEAGRTVPPGDVDALARTLVELRDDPALRRRLSEAAQRRVTEEFGIGPWRDRLWEVVSGVMDQPR